MDNEVITPFPFGSPTVDKIAAALAAAQGEIGKVIKNETAEVQGKSKTSGKDFKYNYTYATLDAVMEAIKPLQAKHGLAVIQRPHGNFLQTILVHSSGQWINYGDYPLGQSDNHKDRGGAITFARRYVNSAIFGVAPEEDDDATKANESLGRQPQTANPVPPASHQSYKPKEAYIIEAPITRDGGIDFDSFAADFESKITSAPDMNAISMLKKANAKTLNAMKPERPDLFEHLVSLTTQIANALM